MDGQPWTSTTTGSWWSWTAGQATSMSTGGGRTCCGTTCTPPQAEPCSAFRGSSCSLRRTWWRTLRQPPYDGAAGAAGCAVRQAVLDGQRRTRPEAGGVRPALTGQVPPPRRRTAPQRRRPRRPAPRPSLRRTSVEVVAEATGGVAGTQLPQGLLLDLPDPLAGQTQPRPDLGQRVLPTVDQAVAQADDLTLPL